MLPPPLLDTGDMGWAFEVILVLRFSLPTSLGQAFALGATDRLRTKTLVTTIARIGSEEGFAMQALNQVSGQRHPGRKKTYRQGNRHPKLPRSKPSEKRIREENGRRMKKKSS